MNFANKRKLAISAALVGFMVALADEEDDEGDVLPHQEESKRQRKYWVNPFLQQRNGKGKHANFENLTKNPSHFFANFHMSFESFQSLFSMIEPHLIPRKISRGTDYILPEQKLAAVLEYLASGDLQQNISSSYRISKQYFGQLVDVVCKAIAHELQWEIPQWEKYSVLASALDFQRTWDLPNCVGAIGGRLMEVRAPMHRRKGINTMPIFAICDASLRFIYLDVGDVGTAADPNVFANSNLGKAILSDNLYFPGDRSVNGAPMTYYVVAGDDTFPLINRIMKPYGSEELTSEERYFNYRLDQAGHCIDDAFGILSAKWMVMQRSLICRADRAKYIATACCLLHNYLRRIEPEYTDWAEVDNGAMLPLSVSIRPGHTEDYPKFLRDCIKNSLIVKRKASLVKDHKSQSEDGFSA